MRTTVEIFRKEQGLTRRELCIKCNITEHALYKIEKQLQEDVSLKTARAISRSLNKPIDELFIEE